MSKTALRAYWKRCDNALFKNPRSGIEAAKQGLAQAQQSKDREFEALALAVLAGAHRVLGEFDRANQLYGEAHELRLYCSPLILAEIDLRLSVLRGVQGRIVEGIELVSSSDRIFSRPDDRARAKVTRGNLYCEGFMSGRLEWLAFAIQDFAEALNLVDLETSPNITLAAVHGVVVAIAESPAPRLEDLETALRAISHFCLERNTAPNARVLWARGLITRCLGSWNRAEKLLTDARDEFARLGLPVETALVSLDLGGLYYLYPDSEEDEPGRWERLGEVAAHAVMLFRDRFPAETHAALLMWRDAITHQDLTENLARRVRRTVATGDLRFLRNDQGISLAPPPSTPPALPQKPGPLALPAVNARERELTRLAVTPTPRRQRGPWKGRRLGNIPLQPADADALSRIADDLDISHAEATRVAIREYAALREREQAEAERKRWEAPKKPKPWEGLE